MPIPALTNIGLLPLGIFDCTLEEIEQTFAHIPPQKEREALWQSFLSYVDAVKKTGLATAMYVDGGFTTAVKRANDVDVVLELPPPSPATRAMIKQQIFHPKKAKEYRVHLFLGPDWTPAALVGIVIKRTLHIGDGALGAESRRCVLEFTQQRELKFRFIDFH